MKKVVKILAVLALIGLGIWAAVKDVKRVDSVDLKSVSYNGDLHVDGAQLMNRRGKEMQLVGISSHGIQWFEELYTKENITKLKEDFGINVFRIAMYTDPEKDGYIKNEKLAERVKALIDICIELDIYAIVDWHILDDGDPKEHEKEALDFFDEISKKYANVPNVIYEICNEPNGDKVDWRNTIKPYAEKAIAKIRANSPKALIIVGTPKYSKDLIGVSEAPLNAENIMYAMHFYAGTDNITLRDEIDEYREDGLPIFISECGATDSSGDGKLYKDGFERWAKWLRKNKISWIYWAYSDGPEASSTLKDDGELSESGEIFRDALKME